MDQPMLHTDAPVRVLSLEPWGHRKSQTGRVSQLAWAPDACALAVGFAHQGLVVWSPSGCRLLCNLRQPLPTVSPSGRVTMQSEQLSTSTSLKAEGQEGAGGEVSIPLPPVFERGVSALCWGPHGYTLTIAEAGPGGSMHLCEQQFARSLLPTCHHRVAHSGGSWVAGTGQHLGEELHVLQAHDRLLIIAEAIHSGGAVSMAHGGGPGDDSPVGNSNDLLVCHVPVPLQYIQGNWPINYAAVSSNGMDMAVAGTHGLALYSRAADKWRLFGDVSQERRISCRGLCWLDSVVVVCSGPPLDGPAPRSSSGAPAFELLLFPRYHLDFSSLLCRYPLYQPPVAIDCVGSHIIIASEPLEIALFEVEIKGALTPLGKPKATLHLIREISMLDAGQPLRDLALVAPPPTVQPVRPPGSGASGSGAALPQGPALPKQCVLLRWGGLMSVLDLERGCEVALATEVECFWLSDSLPCEPEDPLGLPGGMGSKKGSMISLGAAAEQQQGAEGMIAGVDDGRLSVRTQTSEPGPQLAVEMPWWAYGPQGMQLWFPSSLQSPLTSKPLLLGRQQPQHQDIELEFDQEVYPVGISLADAAIVGVTQRLVRGTGLGLGPGSASVPGSHLPCFHPVAESQPVLPCLLRRLLQRGAMQEALSLARRHESGPHFTRSLEWLLFTTLEMEASKPLHKRNAQASQAQGTSPSAEGPLQRPESGFTPVPISPLLASAAELVHCFPQVADVAVSVARKTDAALWPPLFSAMGMPSLLLEGLVEAGSLTSAACFLLVVDRLEGAAKAHTHALQLLRLALQRGQSPLVGELLRFIIPPREEDEYSDVEDPALAAQQPQQPETVNLIDLTEEEEQPAAAPAPAPAKSSGWFGWLFGGSSKGQQQQPEAEQEEQQQHLRAHRPPPLQQEEQQPQQQELEQPLLLTTPGGTHAAHTVDAHRIMAEHAWDLLEQGQLGALVQLASAVAFIGGGGLVTLMNTHRSSAYAREGVYEMTAVDLMYAVTVMVQEFPVWTGPEVEGVAASALDLCKAIGATVWVVALGLVLVSFPDVIPLAQSQPQVWDEFVGLLRADPAFFFLYDLLDALEANLQQLSEQQQAGGAQQQTEGPTGH